MRAFVQIPDIIMVGESRDKETVSMGIEASLTGHLVFPPCTQFSTGIHHAFNGYGEWTHSTSPMPCWASLRNVWPNSLCDCKPPMYRMQKSYVYLLNIRKSCGIHRPGKPMPTVSAQTGGRVDQNPPTARTGSPSSTKRSVAISATKPDTGAVLACTNYWLPDDGVKKLIQNAPVAESLQPPLKAECAHLKMDGMEK